MAEIALGKLVLNFFRPIKDEAKENGTKIKFLTESTLSKEKESEATPTTDGIVNTITDGENSIEGTLLAYFDTKEVLTAWEKLEDCFDNNEKVGYWQVRHLDEKTKNIKAVYYEGYFSAFEMSAPADGKVEISYTYVIDGKGAKGTETLTEEQMAVVKATQYEYKKIIKATEEV